MLLARRIILLLFLLIPCYGSVRGVKSEVKNKVEVIPMATIQNVYTELLNQGIEKPEIVIRQVIAETKWLKCRNCSMKFNNLFGFLTKKGYIEFKNWKDSVRYYKKWQDQLYKGGDYYAFLSRVGYATAPNYIQLLKQIDPSEFI